MQRLKGKKCMLPLVEFGKAVMFRVVGKVQGGDMRERWHTGLFLGKRPGSEENLVMKEDGGVVRARAVRELLRPVTLADLDKIRGTPHDPTGTLRGVPRDEGRPEALREPEVADADLGSVPKWVQITKDVVLKFGATPGCSKCRGVRAGDRAYQYVHHTDACRNRMTELMKQDGKFGRLVQAAEDRQTKRIADMLERRDREASAAAARHPPAEPAQEERARKRHQPGEGEQQGGDPDRSRGGKLPRALEISEQDARDRQKNSLDPKKLMEKEISTWVCPWQRTRLCAQVENEAKKQNKMKPWNQKQSERDWRTSARARWSLTSASCSPRPA